MCPELRSWLSVSAREIPVLTGVNGTLMARRSWPEPGTSSPWCSSSSSDLRITSVSRALLAGFKARTGLTLVMRGPSARCRYEQAPSHGGDGACAADRVPGLAPPGCVLTLDAFDRLAIDVDVLDRVARRPAVIAERRILLWILQEVHNREPLDRPHWAASVVADVDHAALKQDRVLHIPPIGDCGPLSKRGPGGPLHPRVGPAVPVRLPFKGGHAPTRRPWSRCRPRAVSSLLGTAQ